MPEPVAVVLTWFFAVEVVGRPPVQPIARPRAHRPYSPRRSLPDQLPEATLLPRNVAQQFGIVPQSDGRERGDPSA